MHRVFNFPTYRALFSVIILMLTLLSSCKKREAKAGLLGDWKVTAYKGVLLNECTGQSEYFDVAGMYGTVTFDTRLMQRDYALLADTGDCYPFGSANDLPTWKVTGHSSELTVAHRYTLDIDGESWYVLFGDDGVGERADDQEFVYLGHISTNGTAISMQLTRDPN